MNNYTKGEWKVAPTNTGHYNVFCDKGLIADVFNNIEGCEANARLIASLPELLQCAYIAQALINSALFFHPDDEVAKIEGKIINKAIAKAEGR